jgi:hypothetical protein
VKKGEEGTSEGDIQGVARRLASDCGDGYEDEKEGIFKEEESTDEEGVKEELLAEFTTLLLNLVFLRDIMGGGSIFPFS